MAVKARVQLLQEQLQELDELLEAKSFAMFASNLGIPTYLNFLNEHDTYQTHQTIHLFCLKTCDLVFSVFPCLEAVVTIRISV